jgi:uncharacterized damage-inducible protein DinB
MAEEVIYRPGIIGALMDEYERAALDIAKTIHPMKQAEFVDVLDEVTSDQQCRSIQRIMEHVISAGYGYADYVRRAFDKSISPPPLTQPFDAQDAIRQLLAMFEYSLDSFEGRWEMIEEEVEKTIIKTSWGVYNLEQLLEHAIVHVLRHRRQINYLVAHPKKRWSGK